LNSWLRWIGASSESELEVEEERADDPGELSSTSCFWSCDGVLAGIDGLVPVKLGRAADTVCVRFWLA
jgi:hypothetical protein